MSCLCSSENKTFLFVGNKLRYSEFRRDGCSMMNFTTHILSLTAEDYEVIRGCKPATSQGHRIGLIYNWVGNKNPNCSQNVVDPYFWGVLPKHNRTCVNGSPFTSASNKPESLNCQVATLVTGSSYDTFYNISWTPCNNSHPFICRQNAPIPDGIPLCERGMTTTTYTSNSNNNTIIVAVATASALLFLIFLILFCLLYYNLAKRRKSEHELNNDQQKKYYKQVFRNILVFDLPLLFFYNHSKTLSVTYLNVE